MNQNRALNAYAYDHLRDMIYNGEFEYNRVYSETKLAAELSVSRTPIRDALNRLMQERYIDILPNRGFMLHMPNYSDTIEAYHVRAMIETYCAEYVCLHHDDPDAMVTINIMAEALEKQCELLAQPDQYTISKFWIQDLRFHKAVVKYMNISSFDSQYDCFMHIFMPHHLIDTGHIAETREHALERHRSTVVEHREIIEALKSGDTARTRQAVHTHLDSSLRAVFMHING